jgi:hypothetical protein
MALSGAQLFIDGFPSRYRPIFFQFDQNFFYVDAPLLGILLVDLMARLPLCDSRTYRLRWAQQEQHRRVVLVTSLTLLALFCLTAPRF